MINEDKWINSISNRSKSFTDEVDKINSNKWINSIPKKNPDKTFKKYTISAILFVCGLLLVSALKNESRNLQKEIHGLKASINSIKYNLHQANLDHEVITSPENLTKLAKVHLNIDLTTYKKSQIKILEDENKNIVSNSIIKEKNKKNINLKKAIKNQIVKKIEKRKKEIKKLEELYQNPKTIPTETKEHLAKRIQKKKDELKKIYNSPRDIFTTEKLKKWGAVQVVKLFLGIPVVPGR